MTFVVAAWCEGILNMLFLKEGSAAVWPAFHHLLFVSSFPKIMRLLVIMKLNFNMLNTYVP